MDEREIDRIVRETYADMPVPPLPARKPARRPVPLAGVTALAAAIERGAEGALLWPEQETVLFASFSGPAQATLKAVRFGAGQRVDELGATDGLPLAFDPAGRGS